MEHAGDAGRAREIDPGTPPRRMEGAGDPKTARGGEDCFDLLCFGRSGVGKTALLEGITGRHLGSTPRLDHGTATLTCIEAEEQVPQLNGGTKILHIRFWDTKGIDQWTKEEVPAMFDELERAHVRPVCVFYCTTGSGRVATEVLEPILRKFCQQNIIVVWVVTHMYATSDEQFDAQMEAGKETVQRLSGHPAVLVEEDVFTCGARCFVVGVNSKTYENRLMGIKRDPKNLDKLMQLCVEHLEGSDAAWFFFASLSNKDFWSKAISRIKHLLLLFGIDVDKLAVH